MSGFELTRRVRVGPCLTHRPNAVIAFHRKHTLGGEQGCQSEADGLFASCRSNVLADLCYERPNFV
jgi:hypothetical protein